MPLPKVERVVREKEKNEGKRSRKQTPNGIRTCRGRLSLAALRLDPHRVRRVVFVVPVAVVLLLLLLRTWQQALRRAEWQVSMTFGADLATMRCAQTKQLAKNYCHIYTGHAPTCPNSQVCAPHVSVSVCVSVCGSVYFS